MARYVDADALLERLTKKKTEVAKARYTDGFNDAISRVRSMISSASTEDVVEVVRCKDCVHYQKGVCNHFGYYTYAPDVEEDDFCSYGERKENEQ